MSEALDLDAIRARTEAATTGPWRDVPMGSEGSTVFAGGLTIHKSRRIGRCGEFADAEFIAHARTDVPALLAEVERLRTELLVERSSLGTPAAKAARASVSDEAAARVVARARELDRDPTRVTCPSCGASTTVTKGGMVRRHRREAEAVQCDASRTPWTGGGDRG